MPGLAVSWLMVFILAFTGSFLSCLWSEQYKPSATSHGGPRFSELDLCRQKTSSEDGLLFCIWVAAWDMISDPVGFPGQRRSGEQRSPSRAEPGLAETLCASSIFRILKVMLPGPSSHRPSLSCFFVTGAVCRHEGRSCPLRS